MREIGMLEYRIAGIKEIPRKGAERAKIFKMQQGALRSLHLCEE